MRINKGCSQPKKGGVGAHYYMTLFLPLYLPMTSMRKSYEPLVIFSIHQLTKCMSFLIHLRDMNMIGILPLHGNFSDKVVL